MIKKQTKLEKADRKKEERARKKEEKVLRRKTQIEEKIFVKGDKKNSVLARMNSTDSGMGDTITRSDYEVLDLENFEIANHWTGKERNFSVGDKRHRRIRANGPRTLSLGVQRTCNAEGKSQPKAFGKKYLFDKSQLGLADGNFETYHEDFMSPTRNRMTRDQLAEPEDRQHAEKVLLIKSEQKKIAKAVKV